MKLRLFKSLLTLSVFINLFNAGSPSILARPITPRIIKTQVNSQTPNVDIAVYDIKNAKLIHYTKGTLNSSYTASIVKVSILVQLLHQKPKLTPYYRQLAAKMIKNSDNTAATILFQKIGRAPGLQKLFKRLKMRYSFADRRWGMTKTTALDQIKLLKQIYTSSTYISVANQKYIRNLMHHVNQYQRWGLPQTYRANTKLYVKDGWLTLNEGAVINSLSRVKTNKANYLLVILSHKDLSQNAGFKMLNRVGQVVYKKMNQN